MNLIQSKGVRPQGLKRYKRHDALLSHKATFGSIAILPSTLGRIPQYVKDQANTGYCTAFARSTAGSYLFGQEMSEEFQTANEGKVAGAPISDGTDPQTADLATTRNGFLPKSLCPLSFVKDGFIRPADWRNYNPSLYGEAIRYLPHAPYDVNPTYDEVKQALFQGLTDNAIVIANGFWYEEFNRTNETGIALMPVGSPTTRHDYAFIDWATVNGTEYLIAQLSQGTGFGKGGFILFSREVFTEVWKNPIYNGIGCEIFRKDNGQNNQNVIISLYQHLVQLLGQILTVLSLKR